MLIWFLVAILILALRTAPTLSEVDLLAAKRAYLFVAHLDKAVIIGALGIYNSGLWFTLKLKGIP